jgi:hypothetical protein
MIGGAVARALGLVIVRVLLGWSGWAEPASDAKD